MENQNKAKSSDPKSKAEMPKMTEHQKAEMLSLAKELGSWEGVLAILDKAKRERDLSIDKRWDLCKKAAEKIGVHWQVLADEMFYKLDFLGIKHYQDPGSLNSIWWPIINLGLNPFNPGELHIVKFGNWYQPLIGLNGVYRLTSENPRFLNVEWEYSEQEIVVGVVKTPQGIELKQTCPKYVKCIITFVDKLGNIRTTSKIKYLTDTVKQSPAWHNAVEMLQGRAFTSCAKIIFGLAMSDEFSDENNSRPASTQKAGSLPAPQPEITPPEGELVIEGLE